MLFLSQKRTGGRMRGYRSRTYLLAIAERVDVTFDSCRVPCGVDGTHGRVVRTTHATDGRSGTTRTKNKGAADQGRCYYLIPVPATNVAAAVAAVDAVAVESSPFNVSRATRRTIGEQVAAGRPVTMIIHKWV